MEGVSTHSVGFTDGMRLGKTIIFSHLASQLVAEGGRVLILAHREELIRQAADKLKAATGLACAIEKAEESSVGCFEMVTVGSIQSLQRIERRTAIAAPTHIIADEAAHILSPSWLEVVNHWPDAKVLGVTATPDRGDMRDLGNYFESLAFEYSLPKAIAEGYLCKIYAETVPLKIDLNGIKQVAGDFDSGGVAKALEPYLPHIASEIATRCKDRKVLIFAPLCDTSQKIQGYLNAAGFKCFYASGEDRSQMKEWEAHGKGCAMVNAMLLTEGYDHPAIDTVVVLRPTKVRSLYSQMAGRGTRLFDGKDHLLLLDFLWMSEKHSLCRPANLLAPDEETAQAMTDYLETTTEDVEVSNELLELASHKVLEQREAALAKKLAEMRHRKRALVDPLQYAMSVGDEQLATYQPTFEHDKAAPTPGQIEQLGKAGIFPEEINSKGYAQALLTTINERKAAGLARPRQVRCLERYGFKHVGQMTYAECQLKIARIAANGWRLPDNLRKEVA